MRQHFVTALILSLLIHLCLFVSTTIRSTKGHVSKVNFNFNNGESSIKLNLSLRSLSSPRVDKLNGKLKSIKKEKKKTSSKKSLQSKNKVNRGSNSVIAKYLSNIRQIILNHKLKTRLMRRLRLKGRVRFSFTISRPNTVSDIIIMESSDNKIIDQSVLDTINSITNFPSIPNEVKDNLLTIDSVIIYE